jgi:DNA-damage-inducible protein D
MGQETRNKLTDYWKNHEIKGEDEYAILTNIIHQEWSDVSVKEHNHTLRDELIEDEVISQCLYTISQSYIPDIILIRYDPCNNFR